MMLNNPGFEGGWWRRTHSGIEYDNIFVPEGWTAFWDEIVSRPEMKMINREPPFIDPPRIYAGQRAVMWFSFFRSHSAGLYQSIAGLTPGAEYRISAFVHAWFSQRDNAHQSEYESPPGTWHEINDGEPGIDFWLGIDPTGGHDPASNTVIWDGPWNIYDAFDEISMEFIAGGDVATVFIKSVAAYPFKHCDAYLDEARIELVEAPSPPVPPVNYVVVAELLPQDATRDELIFVIEETFAERRTHLQSADDAARLVAPGLPGSKVNVWGRARWPGDIESYLRDRGVTLIEFYEFEGEPEPPGQLQLTYPTTHLPPVITQPFIPGQHGGIDLRSSWAVWGDELIAALPATIYSVGHDPDHPVFGYQLVLHAEFGGQPIELRYAHLVENGAYVTPGQVVRRGDKIGRPDNTGTSTADHLHFSCKIGEIYVDPEPLILWPGTPEPPAGGEPAPYPLRSSNHIGLHSGFTRACSWPYIEQSSTNIQKFFSAGDAYQAGIRAPGIISVWRKFVGDPGITDPIADQAQWYVDQYTAEINTAATNLGISVETLLSRITAVESLNETIPSNNPTQIQRAVEFDVCFAEKLYARYGDLVAPCLLNTAIGNPLESEVSLLIPAAQASVDHHGFLGYHSYWTRNETQGFIELYWQWHAGRWMEWDTVFRAAGIYPRYALGEGGIVYAPDGVSFNSGKGWKSCGSFEKYLQDIQIFNERVKIWNAEHANRCAGITLFGYGNWGWSDFELGDGEISLLQQWSTTL